MHCLGLHYPQGHISLIAFTSFARRRKRTHPQILLKVKSLPPSTLPPKRAVQVIGLLLQLCGEFLPSSMELVSAAPAATRSTAGKPPLLPELIPRISADRVRALRVPEPLRASRELAERRPPLRMHKTHPHLQSWLSLNEQLLRLMYAAQFRN